MRQLIIEAPGRPAWREVPRPEPGPGEILMEVRGVTTCPHWDLHIMDGEPMFPGHTLNYPYLPGQPGHEAMGVVAAVGADVRELRVGDPVVAWRDTGQPRPGFYAQCNTFAEDDVLKVAPGLTAAQIAPLELAMCVEVSFQRLAGMGGVAGRRVGVAGLGPGGLVAVQLARAHGAAAVVGIDPVDTRRGLALRLGADEVVAPDAATWPASRHDKRALDVAVDCTGLVPSIEFLLDRTRRVVTIFGVLRGEVRYAGRHMWGPGVTLMGYGDHNRAAAETSLRLVEAGRLDLAALVTHTLPLSRYAEGVELLRRREAIKVLFEPWA
jgi:threonine dehydrogenase-like Zn-dependent dehydrogenase